MNTLHLLELRKKKTTKTNQTKKVILQGNITAYYFTWLNFWAENMIMCRSEIPENSWGKKKRMEKSAKIDFQSWGNKALKFHIEKRKTEKGLKNFLLGS